MPALCSQRLFGQGQVAAIGSSSFEHEGEQPIRLGVPRETGTPASWAMQDRGDEADGVQLLYSMPRPMPLT
jgi:hypothetical protein